MLEVTNRIEKRNFGIDVIRGLCILAVVLLHLNIHFGYTNTFIKQAIPPKVFSLFFWSGYYGVVIFFTLSGFLITNTIIKRWGTLSKVNLATFYWFRFSRIIPLLILLLTVLSILHLFKVSGFVINEEQTSLWRAVFAALTFHVNWLEIQVGYLPASWDILWSISIEETFYLIFPVVCLFLKKDWHFVIVLILFLLVSPWARTNLYIGNELADKNHFAYLDSIALGCMSAIVATRLTFAKWMHLAFLLIGLAMVVLVVYFRGFVYKSGLVESGLNISILSFGIALILIWLHENHQSGKQKKFRAFNGLRRMGVYSYEIYLTHMFVVLAGVKIFKYFEFGANWLIPFALLIIFVSYLLGSLIHNYISEPINLWLRSWRTKR